MSCADTGEDTESLEKRCLSRVLSRGEEMVLVTLSLNPGKGAEAVRDELPFSDSGFNRFLDGLLDRGLVDMADGDAGDGLVWRVTDLGVVRLFEMSNEAKALVLEGQCRDKGEKVMSDLRRQRRVSESALKQARVLFQ